MRTDQTFIISFFIRKKKNLPGKADLYTRITINGVRLEISLKRTFPIELWLPEACRVAGYSSEANSLNAKMDQTRALLYKAFDELQREEQLVTTHMVKSRYLGTDVQHKTLHDLINFHNNNMKGVLKKGTLKNYYTTGKYLEDYLFKKYRLKKFFLRQINYEFILGFENFLRSQPGLNNNGLMKHMERFKKMMRLAEDLEWIDKNPTKRFKLRFERVDVVYLSKSELESIKKVELVKPNLKLTRDLFIFACYTGLAYTDVKNLSRESIQIGIDGKNWIYTKRAKTDTAVRIPLLAEAWEIIESYANHPLVRDSEKLLPIYSNQKINQYLKNIATITEINKKLSFHAARHTFATTVTLSNGVPIETVSKLLGHHKISTTQVYARVIDTKISTDIDVLRKKLVK